MPMVVLAAFYMLKRVREHPAPAALAPAAPSAPATPPPVQ
jgi:hypothetical protein